MKKKNVLLGLMLSVCVCLAGGIVASSSVVASAQQLEQPALTSFTTSQTASVRMLEPAGIRFTTEISKTEYAALLEKYTSVEFGTLIVPNDLANDNYTLENANAKSVKRTVWDLEYNPDQNTDVYKYNGVLTNIYEQNYNRIFAAVGYVTLDGTTYYATENGVALRSPVYVASAAIAKGTESDFLYEMVDTVMEGESLTLSQATAELKVGNAQDLDLTATVDGNEVVVTYAVANPEIATYADGKLTALSAGTTEIVATLQGKETAYTAKCAVTVEKAVVTLDERVFYDTSVDSMAMTMADFEMQGTVESVTISNETIPFTENDGVLTLSSAKAVVTDGVSGYYDRANGLVIETEATVYKLTVGIVTKIIRQADITADGETLGNPAKLDAILYNDGWKTTGSYTNWGGYYVLGENLTFDGTKAHATIHTSYTERFNGVLDGLGHTIANYSVGGANGAMLFGLGVNGVVRNIHFDNPTFNKSGTNWYTESGGLIAVFCYGKVENVLVEMDYTVGESVSISKRLNGVLVNHNEGTVENCITVVDDKTESVVMHGYLVGLNQATMANSYAIAKRSNENATTIAGLVATNGKSAGGKQPTSATGTHTTCKVFDNTDGTGFTQFYADTDVTAAIANYGDYWKFDATAGTIGMGALATDIL